MSNGSEFEGPSVVEDSIVKRVASRRDAIKWGLAALAGAGLSALAPATAYASTGNLQYGADNDAGGDQTYLVSSNGLSLLPLFGTDRGATLRLVNTHVSSGGGLLATRGHCLHASQDALGDTAVITHGGSSNAVYAGATDGSGVYASSTTGYGVFAVGGKAPIRLSPTAAAGAPTTGSHSVGEFVVDSAGVVWTCTTGGTPGVWVALAAAGAAVTAPSATISGAATIAGATTLAGAAAVGGVFSMTRSGRKRIAKGAASGSVTVPSGVATTSNIICTLQNSAGTGVYVRYAKRTGANTFKIYLNKKATTKTAYVGWMIVG